MRVSPYRGVAGAALALALACALAVALPARAATTLVVGKAAANSEANIPTNVGYELGFFKKHGLDLKIVDFTGGAKMIQAMTAGQLDIGVGAGVQMAFVAKGAPMMAVCEDASALPFSIGVPWDSPLKSLKDLRGKTIGVSSSGSLTDWLAKELARKMGWGLDGIKRAAIGSSPSASVSAFRLHLIDAYVGGTSTFLRMAEKKVGRVLAPVSSYIGPVVSGTIFASNHLIETNPDAIRAFLAGWLDTTQFIRTHKAETVKIESRVTGYSENVMSQDYDLTSTIYTHDCKFDPELLATLHQSFTELRFLKTAPDISKLYTEAYLPR